jgi:Zn-dependent alcohol dehydrogenase
MAGAVTTARSLVAHKPVDGKSNFKMENVLLRELLKDDEVMVRMIATGICHTDLTFASRRQEAASIPQVLGHEG